MNKIYKNKFYEKTKLLILVITTIVVSVLGLMRKKANAVQNAVFIFLLFVAFGKLKDRDYYLPFLGDSVFPNNLLEETTPDGYNTIVKVKVPGENSTKVVYWASLENNGTNNQMPWTAYGNYRNSGVTMSNSKGEALLKIISPRGYKTPWGKSLKPHVHYRYFKTNGMMSRVYTQFI